MSDAFSFSFDSASLQAIRGITGFSAFLDPAMLIGMQAAVDLLQADARSYMYATFQNPQGALEDAVDKDVPDSYTGTVFNESPYAWRREEGFSGMTDSLGRFYPNDPGIHYFATTLAQDTPQLEAIFAGAVTSAASQLGGP